MQKNILIGLLFSVMMLFANLILAGTDVIEQHPEWATSLENIYTPVVCKELNDCIVKDVEIEDPYDASFIMQIQNIQNLWSQESAKVLASRINKLELHKTISNHSHTHKEILHSYNATTVGAMYQLDQIQTDRFLLDNNQNDLGLTVDGNDLQICQHIQCNGDLPLQVRVMVTFNLPK